MRSGSSMNTSHKGKLGSETLRHDRLGAFWVAFWAAFSKPAFPKLAFSKPAFSELAFRVSELAFQNLRFAFRVARPLRSQQ